MRLEVQDSNVRSTGIDSITGNPVIDIPDSSCGFQGDGGSVVIQNPPAETYIVTYFGEYDRDFRLDVAWTDDSNSESIQMTGFRPAAPGAFEILFDPSGDPRITVIPAVTAPTD